MNAREIAVARVEKEDTSAKEVRILEYENEINEALETISEAKEAGEKRVSIIFDGGSTGPKGDRVREALQELHYECTEYKTKEGDFVHGYGYRYYKEMYVTLE